jgi:phage-related protein
MPAFEMLGEVEKKLPDGTQALEIVYKYVPAENYVLYQKQFYFIKEEKAFVFTGTFSKKTLKTIANDFDKIIASFLMIKPIA